MKTPHLVIGSILIIMTMVSSNLNWSRSNWQYMIEADAKGYYAYLPAIFIYKDLNFDFFEKIELDKYYQENLYYNYRTTANGSTINKYYCGTAAAQLPFFLIGHLVTLLVGNEPDGYSYWYPVMTNVAALVYLLGGLWCLTHIFTYFKINLQDQTIALLAVVFGSNLFYYTVGEPGMSHIFSFGWIAYFLMQAFRYFQSKQKSALVLLGLSLGMITLIRPINILVVLLLPFVAGSWTALSRGIIAMVKHWKLTILSLFLFFCIVFIQLIIYRLSTGLWFVYSYGDEGFHFLDPHFFDILFSYRKGLFVYTPIYLLALLGLVPLFRSNRFRAIMLLLFLGVLTYILSSWWMWYYGGSFSSRVYVEYVPLFTIALALALQWARKHRMTFAMIAALFVLVVVCQIQTYQYRYYEIHWSDMTKEKYWDVFLRIDKLIK